ncbi:MAG TPA: DUF2783 domain-containing protein [Casimicrobiaceae bacterium]|jgi:hypothetical protein|nr:DUF2783 domain-containing protein [Casimicrobiaceae bacterium]
MTGVLNIEPNLAAPDEFYEALIDMHRGLDAQQSAMVNARLILLLANHVGDLAVLREAMTRARAGVREDTHASADPRNA